MSETASGRPQFPLQGKRIWVAGHRGMVGSAVVRALLARGDCEVLTAGRDVLDLREQGPVRDWLCRARPQIVVLAAARVGGIHANESFPVDFLYDNLAIATNVVHGAHLAGVERLLNLGSSCIYPRLAPQPMAESALLTGPLEPTNEWYAIAKIAAIKLCQAYRAQHGHSFISAMPTNLYGPNDNFDLASSHVLPALMRKIHEAQRRGDRTVTLWGTGTPKREFMHVDDLAAACLFLLERYDDAEHVNVGVGSDVTILELAGMIAEVIGFRGRFAHDVSKPDGPPRKLMDSSRLLAMGWRPDIALPDGLRDTYAWYRANETVAAAAG